MGKKENIRKLFSVFWFFLTSRVYRLRKKATAIKSDKCQRSSGEIYFNPLQHFPDFRVKYFNFKAYLMHMWGLTHATVKEAQNLILTFI
jgi:hypothetical protein